MQNKQRLLFTSREIKYRDTIVICSIAN